MWAFVSFQTVPGVSFLFCHRAARVAMLRQTSVRVQLCGAIHFFNHAGRIKHFLPLAPPRPMCREEGGQGGASQGRVRQDGPQTSQELEVDRKDLRPGIHERTANRSTQRKSSSKPSRAVSMADATMPLLLATSMRRAFNASACLSFLRVLSPLSWYSPAGSALYLFPRVPWA